ncbi:MAG: methyltransferase family protein [Candidatus Hodarchaeales archaeon]|jgi:protein-S-isoprenylcysteine O-methyltransferase Ste14
MNDTWSHYGHWGTVIVWIVIFGLFLLFIPFNQKSQRRPASTYFAFITALAIEMFGIPLSLFIIAWAFGVMLPEGVLWGHTLQQYFGYWGMYLGFLMNLIGGVFIYLGWKEIYRHYWSKEEGTGELVSHGIYKYVRHPQYTGFFLITLGLIIHWATLILLIMWPILIISYYRLAKKEEKWMEEQFGEEYLEYKQKTPMFFPSPRLWLSMSSQDK